MLNFKKINDIAGWAVFLVAAATYILTVEPTASFWDCGEFIACAYKLQVPHPPGAPLFLLIGRLFSFLSFGDVTKVAYWINISSALSSAGTILFLFWSITLLAKKLIAKPGVALTDGQIYAIIGSGVVGALAYTFSDTFWFSAVEAEVYAMSSFFTAFVFWAMLKWEAVADEDGADRWLLLIAYMVGLSIGVHLLNLVAVPSLGFVYYFKRYKANFKGAVAAFFVSLGILFLINNGIIPGLPTIAGKFEVIFVNNFHLPFGSGIAFFMLIFIGALVYGIVYSIKQQKALLNTALLGLIFVLIGYCSYAIILIRSNFDTPINENSPKDVMSFVRYLKREQYGDRPLLYGPQYTADLISQEKGEALYRKGKDRYEIFDYKIINKFDDNHKMLFPRMHSQQGGHASEYSRWTGKPENRKPTMGDNLTFFFKYQLGHMYWRYFLWNFAGREGDIQDAGSLRPWDSDADLPELIKNNKARNNFFMLPLILGLLGIVFQYSKGTKDFLVLGSLFFFTGIALVIYLNSPPIEPRERDYIYVGSFYVFAIWIGLGVLQIIDFLTKTIKSDKVRPIVATGLCLSVPAIMAAKGWDDHDRSLRYHSVDSAKNLLNSCAKNAILFTGGDNDTFPLWYVQEVEGFRTDVRVCNLSLLNTDWYISQMKLKAYESEPLPISLEFANFIEGKNDIVPYVENPQGKNGISLPIYIKLVKEENPAVMMPISNGSTIATLPSSKFILPIDTAVVRHMDFVPKDKAQLVEPYMVWDLARASRLEKAELIMLDMISTNNWERPIYYSSTLSSASYLGLREFFQMEGMTYRLMPYKISGATQGTVNTDVMYERLVKNTFWRNLDRQDSYYDENYRRFPYNARMSFYRLALELFNEGKTEKAKEVINFSLKVIPDQSIPYDVTTPMYIGILLKCDDKDNAVRIADIMAKRSDDELNYYTRNNIKNDMEVQSNLYILNQLSMIMRSEGFDKEAKVYSDIFRKYAGGATFEE